MWPRGVLIFIFSATGILWYLSMGAQQTKPATPEKPAVEEVEGILDPPSDSRHGQRTATSVLELGSASYFIDQENTLALRFPISSFIPATVIWTDTPNTTQLAIQQAVTRFESVDDVWSRDFLEFVVFACDGNIGAEALPDATIEYLQSVGTRIFARVNRKLPGLGSFSEGPYVAFSEGLSPAHRLYPDTHAAFIASLVQKDTKSIKYLTFSTAEAAPHSAVAVPSRLFFTQTTDKPLNGLRFAVKDNINVAGAKTFASSWAYGQLYGVSNTSAQVIQRLLDLGAVIVGKTGMSQFADAEDPTGDFVDFHAPWNPRGDGIRSPGGSSFGAGAATGAYDWVDFTLATDTGGSVRVPAASQSVFGFRPSRGTLSLEGTLLIHRDLDAVGFLSRDLNTIDRVWQGLRGTPSVARDTAVHTRLKLIYPTHHFPVEDAEVQKKYDAAVSKLESILGVQRQEINFADEWHNKNPSKEPFEEYFQRVLYDYVTWGQFHERKKFREEYEAKFGRPPRVNPLTQWRWDLGATMTEADFAQTQSKREEFQEFIESIFGDLGIMITPFMFGEPDARDVYRPRPEERDPSEFALGLRPAFQSPMAGQPEIVFPVGQLPIQSNTSLQEEMYGVIASLIGSKGLDDILTEMAGLVMDALNISREVLTGPAPFGAS